MKLLYIFLVIFSLNYYSFGQEFWQITTLSENTYGIWLNSNDDIFCWVDYSKLFRSTNNGADWDLIREYSNRIAFIDNLNRIYITENYFLYRSTDNGNTWSGDSLHLYNNTLGDFLFLPNGDMLVCSHGNIFRSTDNGNNWVQVLYTNFGFGLSLNKMNGDVYATSDAGLFVSHDNGANWTSIYPQHCRFVRTNNNGHLFMSVGTKIYRSIDNGSSWTDISDPSMDDYIMEICFNSSSHIFTAVNSRGVYRSLNDGNSWEKLQYNGQDLYAQYIAKDNDDYVYVGVMSNIKGLYKSNNSTTNIVSTSSIINEYDLYQNFPNPFNPSTKIKYDLPHLSLVQIKVFDVLGNEIETLVSEEKSAGRYELIWHSNNLSSGVYFYKIIADNFIKTKKMILLR